MSDVEFDPRDEMDAHVLRSARIVLAATVADDLDVGEDELRDDPTSTYTPAELDALTFSLSMALVQLKKLPGGAEAHERAIRRAEDELVRRGKVLRVRTETRQEAERVVRRTFGDDVDVRLGTTGHHMVELVALEIGHHEEVRGKMIQLAAALRKPEEHP